MADVGSSRAAKELHLATTSVDTTIGGDPAQVIDGSTTFKVMLDAEDTLTDLVNKINELGVSVTASVVSDSAGTLRHHLSLISGINGRAGDLLVDGSELGLKFQTLATAQDALLSLGEAGGRLISSTTNVFKDVVEGLDITLTGVSNETITVTVSATSADIETSVQLFVDQYNKLREKIAAYTFYNSQDNSKGTLFGSSDIVRLDSDLSWAITRQYFATGSVRSFTELGISLDENGKLSFDKTRLQARYNADPEGLTKFFTDETNGFAKKVDDVLERLVGRDNSTLVNRARVLQQQMEDAAERIDRLTLSLNRQRERLLLQFYNMELAISKIKSNLSAVESIKYIRFDGSTDD